MHPSSEFSDLPVSPLWKGRPALKDLSLAGITVAAYAPPAAADGEEIIVDEALKKKLRAIGYLE